MKTALGMALLFLTVAALVAGVACADDVAVHDAARVFREARLVRGDANVLKREPIDEALWLWIAGEPGADGDCWRATDWVNFREGGGKV